MFEHLKTFAVAFAKYFEKILEQESTKIDLGEYHRRRGIGVPRGLVAPTIIAFYKAARFSHELYNHGDFAGAPTHKLDVGSAQRVVPDDLPRSSGRPKRRTGPSARQREGGDGPCSVELERDLIRERIKSGIAAAKARG